MTAGFGGPSDPATLPGMPSAGPSYPQGWQPIVSAPSGGRFTRGLRLVGTGFTMARDEPGLMMVPAVAFLVQLVIFGLGALVLWPTLRAAGNADGQSTHLSAGQWLVMVVIGVLAMFRIGGLPRHHHRQGHGPVPRGERDQHSGGPGGPHQGARNS